MTLDWADIKEYIHRNTLEHLKNVMRIAMAADQFSSCTEVDSFLQEPSGNEIVPLYARPEAERQHLFLVNHLFFTLHSWILVCFVQSV